MLSALLVVAVSVYLILQPPWLGLGFAPAAGGSGVVIAAVDAAGPNAGRGLQGRGVAGLVNQNGGLVPLQADDLREEPDILPSYAAFNAFLQRQGELYTAIGGRSLMLQLADGSREPIATGQRPLSSLPVYFWWQVAMGFGSFLVTSFVWVFRQKLLAAKLLLVSGLGALGFSCLSAVYSSRELALSAGTFLALVQVTHLCTVIHTAALLALIGVYPRRLSRRSVPSLCFSAALLAWLLDFAQFMPSARWSHYLFIDLAFVTGLAFVFGQWRATRGSPVERAVMRWFVLAVFAGAVVNIALLKIPLLVGREPVVGQGWVFLAHFLMYVGLALGVTHYRLFDLERWWFRFWLWFFAGLAVVALDIVLIATARVSEPEALFVSLAIAGWLYFPVRQWVWARMTASRGKRPVDVLSGFASQLIVAGTTRVHDVWLNVLDEVFRPLTITADGPPIWTTRVASDGETLQVPALVGPHSLVLRHACGGSRLFTAQDAGQADALLDVACGMVSAARAREEGAATERRRIMRDLHDDLGARLLSLVYAAQSEKAQYLARAAMDDLHGIVMATRGESAPVKTAVAHWVGECAERLREAGMAHCLRAAPSIEALPDSCMLPARVQVNIARILREGLSNIIRHGRRERVEGTFRYARGQVTCTFVDLNSTAVPEAWETGNGLRSMQVRADEIDAKLRWYGTADGCRLELRVPVSGCEKLPEADPSGADDAHAHRLQSRLGAT